LLSSTNFDRCSLLKRRSFKLIKERK